MLITHEHADHLDLDQLRATDAPIWTIEAVRAQIAAGDPAVAERVTVVAPGDRFEVVDRQPFGGPLFVRFGEHIHPLGGDLAQAMRVEMSA